MILGKQLQLTSERNKGPVFNYGDGGFQNALYHGIIAGPKLLASPQDIGRLFVTCSAILGATRQR